MTSTDICFNLNRFFFFFKLLNHKSLFIFLYLRVYLCMTFSTLFSCLYASLRPFANQTAVVPMLTVVSSLSAGSGEGVVSSQ